MYCISCSVFYIARLNRSFTDDLCRHASYATFILKLSQVKGLRQFNVCLGTLCTRWLSTCKSAKHSILSFITKSTVALSICSDTHCHGWKNLGFARALSYSNRASSASSNDYAPGSHGLFKFFSIKLIRKRLVL
jgi:hypothetical protein